MSRYIDADDVANAIYHHFPSIRTMADARGIIEEAPSIDIVRCKECRYWHDHITTSSWCSRGAELRPQESGWIKRNADDFCSYGEREGE